MPLFPSDSPSNQNNNNSLNQTPPPIPPSVSSSDNDSQYSSDYNDEWDRYINNQNNNVTRRNRHVSNSPDNDDFIQGRELLLSDLNGSDSEEEESQGSQESLPPSNNVSKPWGNKDMPPIPSYPKQMIDVDAQGFDPFLMDNQIISDYIKEDKKENVVILYNNKYYLSSRAIIDQQENEALVYECLETKLEKYDGTKEYQNIVGNLPLFNLKKIGINISSDNAVGVEPEYIYMDGIEDLLTSQEEWPYYSIIPLPDKMLVSVISQNEALKIGSGFSGVSALHCQAGQGGLAGIMVKAYPTKEVIGGKKSVKKSVKKTKKTLKKKSKKSKKTIKIHKRKPSKKGKKTMKKR